MTLKYLVDYAVRDIKFQELSQRITILERKFLEQEEREIKTLSGRVIQIKKK